jgi:hypothetical protein
VIDLGLSCTPWMRNRRIPEQTYNRDYRAPEFWRGSAELEDPAARAAGDMWALGWVLACSLFEHAKFLGPAGDRKADPGVRLAALTRFVDATERDMDDAETSASSTLDEAEEPAIDRRIQIEPLSRWVGQTRAGKRLSPELQDLVRRLLCYDPTRRCTANQACAHPFFAELHADPFAGPTFGVEWAVDVAKRDCIRSTRIMTETIFVDETRRERLLAELVNRSNQCAIADLRSTLSKVAKVRFFCAPQHFRERNCKDRMRIRRLPFRGDSADARGRKMRGVFLQMARGRAAIRKPHDVATVRDLPRRRVDDFRRGRRFFRDIDKIFSRSRKKCTATRTRRRLPRFSETCASRMRSRISCATSTTISTFRPPATARGSCCIAVGCSRNSGPITVGKKGFCFSSGPKVRFRNLAFVHDCEGLASFFGCQLSRDPTGVLSRNDTWALDAGCRALLAAFDHLLRVVPEMSITVSDILHETKLGRFLTDRVAESRTPARPRIPAPADYVEFWLAHEEIKEATVAGVGVATSSAARKPTSAPVSSAVGYV